MERLEHLVTWHGVFLREHVFCAQWSSQRRLNEDAQKSSLESRADVPVILWLLNFPLLPLSRTATTFTVYLSLFSPFRPELIPIVSTIYLYLYINKSSLQLCWKTCLMLHCTTQKCDLSLYFDVFNHYIALINFLMDSVINT